MDLIAFLHDRYNYDPETGIFTYARDGHRRTTGKRADYRRGKGDNVYRLITGPSGLLYAHRVAWAITYGALPSGPLDHINRKKDDNRIANLRLTTPSLNSINCKRRSTNTSGVRGVHWHPRDKRWHARISVNGERKHLGYFVSKDEAAAAYAFAFRQYYPTYDVKSLASDEGQPALGAN